MKLSQVLADQVLDQSRSRGASYFLKGAVRSVALQDGIIHSVVKGSEPYDVWLEPDGRQLRASCTCPFFFDRGAICKHIWAAILAAEAQSIPLLVPGVAPRTVELYPVDLDDDLDDEGLEYEGQEDRDGGWYRRIGATPPRPTVQAPPAWRQLLDAIGGVASPAPGPRPRLASGQLLYVMDVAASRASGALVIELMTRDRKANGEWGKPRPARLTTADIRALPDPAERQMLERLLGARPHADYGGWTDYGYELSRVRLHGVLAADFVPLFCATARCMVRLVADTGSRPTLLPIVWDDGTPWMFSVSIRRDDVNGVYVIDGSLSRDAERMAVTEPLMALSDDLLVTRTHAARLSHGGAFPWLAALRRADPITIPLNARNALIDTLVAKQPPLADAPDELRVETVTGIPRPRLQLRPISFPRDRLAAELTFDYDGTPVPAASTHPVIRVADAPRAIRRDGEAEERFLATLHELGFRDDWSADTGQRVLQLSVHVLPRIVRPLLDQGWHVEAAGRTYRQPGGVRLDVVSSGIDWFELRGQVEYEGQRASLPALLAALERGESFVSLGDGTIGLLPDEWLRKHATIARLGSREGDGIRFKRTQVGLLDALLAAQPEANWDETFAHARAELQGFEGIRPLDPPATFTGTLRGYQREGLGWLTFLQRFGLGGCLADDMGLGKTVMVMALLASQRHVHGNGDHLPSLVVAPRSVVFNWRQEAARFTPELRVLEYSGTGRPALRGQFGDHDLVITTYGTLRRDATALTGTPFDYIVLDEAQAIKNAASVSAKTTRLLNGRHRLALSGTPIENHLGELWSLFEFLNPGLLSTAPAFERAGAGHHLDETAVGMLARGLRPFMLRRTKAQVAPELPAKTEQTISCELERPQRALYNELRDHYRRTLLDRPDGGGLGRAKLQVLEALLRLRQAACHPGLIDRRRSNEPSAKLDVLVPRVAEAVEEGHKTLVFSQFTSFLAILRAGLDKRGLAYEYLDGHTRDRESKVERFQTDPACRLFLISLKAGGLGLNLTAAEYVFLLDPWWNPAVEAQAIDRAHRIGQARHVFAYRLIARDTVEERVLELQQRKRRLADAILTADNSLIRDLRREDLELLLS
jgi:superfamily II DNA or RNA helicase